MASLSETFVTKSYVKGKKMAGMKKKTREYDRIWRPKSKSSEGPKNPRANSRHAMVSGLTPAQKVARAKRIGTEGPKKTMRNPMSPAAKKAMQNMGTRGKAPSVNMKDLWKYDPAYIAANASKKIANQTKRKSATPKPVPMPKRTMPSRNGITPVPLQRKPAPSRNGMKPVPMPKRTRTQVYKRPTQGRRPGMR